MAFRKSSDGSRYCELTKTKRGMSSAAPPCLVGNSIEKFYESRILADEGAQSHAQQEQLVPSPRPFYMIKKQIFDSAKRAGADEEGGERSADVAALIE